MKQFIIATCIILMAQSLIEWPINQVWTSSYGSIKKFQISSLRPAPNDTFTTQATISLTRDIFWEGLKDLNMYFMYDTSNKSVPIKNKRQFASNAGNYKAGNSIILGFNMTYQGGIFYGNGSYMFSVGQQQSKAGKYLLFYFNMTHSFNQIHSQHTQE